MNRIILLSIFYLAFGQANQVVTGYLMQNEISICMEYCGEYYIETYDDIYWPVVFDDNIQNINLYLNRYIEVLIGSEVNCTECNAHQIQEINFSDDCVYIPDCFVDPCEIAPECQINTQTECISNFCGGCYADFYDYNGNLIDCNSVECENGEINNNNPCNPLECWNGEWFEIIIDCQEQMGVPCLGGVYIPPVEGECCSICSLFGDLNNDLEVNVLDIVLIVSFILITNEPTNAELTVGDINSDGQLNVLDIVAIVQIILNPMNEECYIEPEIGPCEGICPTYYFNHNTNECVEFITGCCGLEAFYTLEECEITCE